MKNEITVKAKCSKNELIDILNKKGFKLIDKFDVIDTYYINKDFNINKATINDILKEYVLLRNIKQYKDCNLKDYYNELKITYKTKTIASNGDIIKQAKYDCKINNKEEGKNLLKALGYKELFDIKEKTVVYINNFVKIEIKTIEDGEVLLELETNKKFNTINKLKQEIKELNIPIDESNFFVKKAENKLINLLGDNND